MKLKALLLGLAIATSHTGYSMDSIEESANAPYTVVRKNIEITAEIYDDIGSILHHLTI